MGRIRPIELSSAWCLLQWCKSVDRGLARAPSRVQEAMLPLRGQRTGGVTRLAVDALEFVLELLGNRAVQHDNHILVIILVGAVAEVERARYRQFAVHDDDLMMHIPRVGVEENLHAGAGALETIILRILAAARHLALFE